MSSIVTFTGKHFDPTAPEENLIDLSDIGHALSLICRGNGHVKYFYSVAQHSIACCREAQARGYSDRVQLACPLHDASEAYMSDVTRPVKALLTEYLKVEENLQNMIWNKYLKTPLTKEEKQQVFEVDDDMLAYEFAKIMPEKIRDTEVKLKADIQCEFKIMSEVEDEFLELAKTYVQFL